jgi:hypothetical protein
VTSSLILFVGDIEEESQPMRASTLQGLCNFSPENEQSKIGDSIKRDKHDSEAAGVQITKCAPITEISPSRKSLWQKRK